MKQFRMYLLCMLGMVATPALFSQTAGYSPFPEHYGKWVISEEYIDDSGGNRNEWSYIAYETSGDTVLSGYTYKKVSGSAKTPHLHYPVDVWTYDFGPRKLAFAYRNDIQQKKVYILTDSNEVTNGNLTNEYVWYDFNIKVGDTLKKTYVTGFDNSFDVQRRMVMVQDTLFICGKYQRRSYFNCAGGFQKDRMIEGVGFIDNFIRTDRYCPFEPIFLSTTYFTCSPQGIQNPAKFTADVSAYPNPVLDILHLKWSEPIHPFSIQCLIMDSSGKWVSENSDAKDEINISQLAKGFYILQVKDKEGNFYRNRFVKQ